VTVIPYISPAIETLRSLSLTNGKYLIVMIFLLRHTDLSLAEAFSGMRLAKVQFKGTEVICHQLWHCSR
jgi:hypothetical protein